MEGADVEPAYGRSARRELHVAGLRRHPEGRPAGAGVLFLLIELAVLNVLAAVHGRLTARLLRRTDDPLSLLGSGEE